MVIALLAAAGSVLLLLVCLAAARWVAARNLEGVLEELDETAPALPEGHRPPPGLGPIPSSDRTLAAEAERGLRDLQAFLIDAA